MGIFPNIVVLRCDETMPDSIYNKISLFCNIKKDCVIPNRTVDVLYEAPLMLEESNLSNIVCRELNLDAPEPDLTEWKALIGRIQARSKSCKIGLVGKYVQLHDAYLSVAEALRHAGYEADSSVEIEWIDSETITEDNYVSILSQVDGILIPGGFGNRGVEGKILACKYARENNVPYLGICLGMQIAVIEYARHVCGLADANSGEFNEITKNNVIDFMPDQNNEIPKGGTLRLGSYPCKIKAGTTMHKLYGDTLINERHRHRYEFNNNFREKLSSAGLFISGTSPDEHIVETVEIPENDFFVGVQFHPEFKSRPNRAHPLFKGLIEASLKAKYKA